MSETANAAGIDLQQFCDGDSYRYCMGSPYVKGGYLCATDCRIAVRIPSDEPDRQAGEGRTPDLHHVFKGENFESVTEPLVISETIRGNVECETCDSTGYLRHSPCPGCDGGGEVECDSCGHMDECETCDGYGFTGVGKCATCNGRGVFKGDKNCIVQGACFDIRYIRKVQSLPGVKFKANGERMACFVFDGGGQGGLMPVERGKD